MSVNKVILIGNVGSEPEVVNFDNGGSISKFTLATNESYKNKQGEKITSTTWHNIQISTPLVDVVQKYVNKGDQVYLEGKIKTRSWDDKEGNKKYLTFIDVKELRMLGGKKEGGESSGNENIPY